jgi:phosphoribosyl 1,2-cyclic phosphate phosphodiesterase
MIDTSCRFVSPNDCQLIFLGTGTSVGVPMIGCECPVCTSDDPRNQRTRCAVAVTSAAGTLLIDTPPDLRTQLLRERIRRVHAVLFTHYHADHVFGLDDVRVFAKYLGGELPIYCDPEVEAFIRRAFCYAFDPDTQKYPAGGVPRVAFRRIERPVCQVLDRAVQPIPLRHGCYDVLGFRFGDLAYCTDVNEIPATSWSLLEGLDVLILDALRFKPHPTHFSFDEALGVIERLRPRQAYLTHLSCKLDPAEAARRLPPNVALAYDGLRLPLAPSVPPSPSGAGALGA